MPKTDWARAKRVVKTKPEAIRALKREHARRERRPHERPSAMGKSPPPLAH